MDVDMAASNGGEPMSPPPPPAKKRRFNEDMNRVAEIVLVLSALGRMRGGTAPTEMELELMVEARSKLAEMCQEFTPKDIIGGGDVRGVIEDLGLNRNGQRLGFRAPEISISEKLSLGKRKMEEAKQFLTPMVSHLSRPNNGVASPGLGKSVSVANRCISGEGTAVNPSGSHLRPKMALNGAAPQGTGVPANSSANYYAGSWSTQPQSSISFASAPSKKVPFQSSVRVRDPTFRPVMSQAPHGTFPVTNQPMQGVQYGQTSSFQNNHSVIAKIVHNVLHPRVKQCPVWIPPSRDYMSKAMTCQMCEVTINEVETVLICDACEKAYHLKCLQANNLKGTPKSEWHCSKCVHAANGKPFPPKYGRAINTASAKKVGSVDTKVNLQKPIVTTGPRVQNVPGFVAGAATISRSVSASVNANTTASTAKTTNTGTQSFKDSLIRCTNSPALASLTKTPNPTAIANKSAGINNGFISKTLKPGGTMSSCTSPLPVGNLVPVNAISNATSSTPVTSSLVAEAPSVTGNGDSSSRASGTADHPMRKTELTTPVQALTVTSSGDSQPEVSQSETAKATEDAARGQALNADDGLQAPIKNVSMCENTSESTSQSYSLNDKTTPENGQESSKDATDKVASETCENHSTETPTAVESDHGLKMTAEPSMPASEPPSVSSNYHSQTEKETPNAQDTVQNVPGDSQKGKGLNGSDDRHHEQPSDP